MDGDFTIGSKKLKDMVHTMKIVPSSRERKWKRLEAQFAVAICSTCSLWYIALSVVAYLGGPTRESYTNPSAEVRQDAGPRAR